LRSISRPRARREKIVPAGQPRRLLIGLAFEITQHERLAQALRQAIQLLIEDGPYIAPRRIGGGLNGSHLAAGALHCRGFSRLLSGFESDAISDLVEPTGDGATTADGAGLAHEGEKSGLKRIFGVLLTWQKPATDVEHQGAVPPQQQLKGGFVPVTDVAFQQFGIAGVAGTGRAGHLPEVANHRAEVPPCHDRSFRFCPRAVCYRGQKRDDSSTFFRSPDQCQLW
jgi:hypothetical protein